MTNKAAIVGAGLAGLSCARTLRRAGFFVEVFEQDSIIGGRLATTRIGGDTFDHGAQYLTTHSQEFGDYLTEISELRLCRPLDTPRDAERRGGGQMSHGSSARRECHRSSVLSRRACASAPASASTPLNSAIRAGTSGSRMRHPSARSRPLPSRHQRREARLLLGRIDELAAPLSRVRMVPCWALMVRVEEKILPDQDVYSDVSEVIRWIARNNTKPGRNPAGENIVIHASPDWSREAEDADPEAVAEELWSEVSHVLGLPPVRPSRMTAHLWRHGLVDQSARRDTSLLGRTQGRHRRRLVSWPACRTCIRERRSVGTRHHRLAQLKSRRVSWYDVAFGELPRRLRDATTAAST